MNTTASELPAGHEPTDAPPGLAEVAEVIAAQRARLAGATDVDGRLLFGIWGVAWFLGYGAIWAAAEAPGPDLVPATVGSVVFMVLLVTAGVVTAVHVGRRTAGVRGASARQGAMYGWSWLAAFASFVALEMALGRAGVSAEVASLVGATMPAVIVGLLYMAGGAIWDDRTQFTMGAWIMAVTASAMLVGSPTLLLIMSVAGGGGLLVAAAVATFLARRGPRPAGGLRAAPHRGDR